MLCSALSTCDGCKRQLVTPDFIYFRGIKNSLPFPFLAAVIPIARRSFLSSHPDRFAMKLKELEAALQPLSGFSTLLYFSTSPHTNTPHLLILRFLSYARRTETRAGTICHVGTPCESNDLYRREFVRRYRREVSLFLSLSLSCPAWAQDGRD